MQNGCIHEPFAKVILQVVKKSRFFTYSPLSLCPFPPMLAIMQKEAEGVLKVKQNGYTLCIRVGSV